MIFAVALALLAQGPDRGTQPPSYEEEPQEKLSSARVAVSDLQTTSLPPHVQRIFLDSLLAELRKLQRVSVIGMDEVRAMLDLEAQKQMAGCNEEESCLAEILAALGADVLIVGGVADLGDASVLTLKRIDQRNAAVKDQFSQRLTKAGGEELLAAIGPAVEKLFADFPLRPGETRGPAPELALRLNPPPLPPVVFWSTAGVSGGALLATSVAGVAWFFAQESYRDLAEQARTAPQEAIALKTREDNLATAEAVTWTLLGVTAASGVAAAVMVPFVDWQGLRDH